MLTLSTNIHEARLDGNLAKLPGDLLQATRLGLQAVEIGIHGLDAIRAGRLDRLRVSAFLGILRDFPLRLSVHAPDSLDLMAERDADMHRAVLDACLEFCDLAGGEVLVVHPGRWVSEVEFGVAVPWRPQASESQDLLEEEATLLRAAADVFPRVRIALENARPYLPYSPYCYAEFPEDLLGQVARVGRPNVGICLDTGHLHMSARLHGYSETEAAAMLGGKPLLHLHVHDNFGRVANWTEKTQTHQIPLGRGDLHMPPGRGDIDYRAVLGPIVPTFRGMAVCELRGRYLADLGDHIDGFRRMMASLGDSGSQA